MLLITQSDVWHTGKENWCFRKSIGSNSIMIQVMHSLNRPSISLFCHYPCEAGFTAGMQKDTRNQIIPWNQFFIFLSDLVWDINGPNCEPRGISPKGLQIACTVANYLNNVICKLNWPFKEESNCNDAHDSLSPNVDSLIANLRNNVSK